MAVEMLERIFEGREGHIQVIYCQSGCVLIAAQHSCIHSPPRSGDAWLLVACGEYYKPGVILEKPGFGGGKAVSCPDFCLPWRGLRWRQRING